MVDDVTFIGKRASDGTGSGFDRPTRTIRFIGATEQPCAATREVDGKTIAVQEVLKVAGCVNLAGIAGAPLLDCHKRESVRDVIGTLNGGEIQGDTIQFTARLSPRVADLDDDFAEGFFNKTSVGYSVLGEEPLDMSTNPPTVNVTAWRLDEMSVVPVPADDRAAIRAARAAPTPTEPTMTDLEKALSDAATQFTASIMTAVRAAKPATPTPPAETAEQKDKREAEEKAAREKDAAARTKRDEDDDDGGDGDGSGGDDAEERKRKRAAMLADLRTIIGTRAAPAFDILVRQRAPAKLIRAAAFALPPVVGERREVTPPVAEVPAGATGTRGLDTIRFSDFGAGPAKR